MNSGQLRHRVRLEENKAKASDATAELYYEEPEDWKLYLHIQAAVDTGSSRQFWAAKQLYQELTHLVTFRWFYAFDQTKELRVTFTDRGGTVRTLYPLGSAVVVGKKSEWLQLSCVEKVKG